MPATPGVSVTSVSGKFHLSNGQTVDFQIAHFGGGEVSWTQWGNTDDNLYVSNGLAEALSTAATPYLKEDESE